MTDAILTPISGGSSHQSRDSAAPTGGPRFWDKPVATAVAGSETAAGNEAGSEDLGRLGWLGARQGQPASPHHYLLLLRFLLLNVIGLALVGVAYLQGLVTMAMEADQTYLVEVIGGVFLIGLVLATVKAWRVSRELNQVRDFDPLVPSRARDYLAQVRGRSGDSRSILASGLRLKLSSRISPVRNLANSLVMLGLIGTVIGFIFALSGVQPDQAGDVSAIGPMVSTLIAGMSTALYTTLVGSLLHIWLMTNYQLLASGTVRLITALVELGETHGAA